LTALATLTTLGCSTVQAGHIRRIRDQPARRDASQPTFRDVLKKSASPMRSQGGGPSCRPPERMSRRTGGGAGKGGGPSSGGGPQFGRRPQLWRRMSRGGAGGAQAVSQARAVSPVRTDGDLRRRRRRTRQRRRSWHGGPGSGAVPRSRSLLRRLSRLPWRGAPAAVAPAAASW